MAPSMADRVPDNIFEIDPVAREATAGLDVTLYLIRKQHGARRTNALSV